MIARSQTVDDVPERDLIYRAVRHAVSKGKKSEPNWARVMHVFALGSTYSAQLCNRFGIDPEARGMPK